MFGDDLNEALLAELPSDKGREARKRVCGILPDAFNEAGKLLRIAGWMVGPDRANRVSPFKFGSDAVVGLATIAQVAGELCRGMTALLEVGNLYSAAALLRQIVEAEYIAWAFAEDKDEAANWLRSSRDERSRFWQPRYIRRRSAGRFRWEDYSRHCEIGGHPTPDSRQLLPDHQNVPVDFLWLDLTYHGVSTWRYIEKAGSDLGYKELTANTAVGQQLQLAMSDWYECDRLSQVKRQFREEGRQ